MRLAERRRSKAQWWDPWVREGVGKGVGSFTVPLIIAECARKLNLPKKRKMRTYDHRGRIGTEPHRW